MAKPRIFISSTYYDLKHIRTSLENFINGMGYEPILFESGDIPFKHDHSLDESCYREIENAHMQILIIGGRYGSEESRTSEKAKQTKDKMYSFYNSITKIEYKTALDKGLPVYVFVEKQVLAEYDTFKNNRENTTVKYAHVDSINIFTLIDEIYSQRTGNYVKGFEKFDDISNWLKEQWAGLFADYLKNNKSKIELKTLSTRIYELGSITGALKEYTEAIMKKIEPDNYIKIIEEEDKRIENEKALTFCEEDMIRYIINECNLRQARKTIYKHFIASRDLEDFLNKLNLTDRQKEEFLVESKEIAERDFADFKYRYQNVKKR